ncbi:hypothetical protein RIF29_39224 [Crotalaria pallida]|uniref:ORC6 second cyclin-like domain-containing protein n=1 Tax=Crotalaria pallida TaxID=3830 RepID=A0AAN9E3U4_CROPI
MVLDQRIRSSLDGSRKSTFSDTASVWESRYLQDISDRKSVGFDNIQELRWSEGEQSIASASSLQIRRASADFTRPVFTAVAFYLCAKKHKLKVDMIKLIKLWYLHITLSYLTSGR